MLRVQQWGIVFGSKALGIKVFTRLKIKRLKFDLPPFDLFSHISRESEYSFLLESMEGPRKLAQYSFLGFRPRLIMRVKNGVMKLLDWGGNKLIKEVEDPLQEIRGLLEGSYIPYKGFRLVGGAVGYISYDAIRYWEKLPEVAEDDLKFPDVELCVYDDGVVFDHVEGRVYYYYSAEDRSRILKEAVNTPIELQPIEYTEMETNLSERRFEEAVAKAKEYIASGDILQVVLSKRFEFNVRGDFLCFYRSLRKINPSPYMFYLKMGDRQIIGSSPEMLVRVEDGAVETYPIAGTRPRVENDEENKALAKELLSDPKERAEHIMLVDLARNDIGRVSEFGSVHVPKFMEVHEYSHVQHIVSRVVGKLRPGCDCCDALRAIFPAGTVSGAPKVRAMEIIEESEPSRRGPYAGAVGYFSFNGDSDFAIAIRTLIASRGKAYIQVGAGIVANSVPEREWFETEHKAQALMRALEASGGKSS